MSTIEKKNKKLPILSNVKCYNAIDQFDIPCQRKTCKNWLDFKERKNCMILTVQSGPLTLNEIGKIYGLTRMRICQIEKRIYQKIRDFLR